MIKQEDNTLRPPDHEEDFLRVAPELGEVVVFDFVPLMNEDSSNMNPTDWTKIAQSVYDRRNAGYDGFVIAHGTDTMHFSASAVALALGDQLRFPVVFTGAQTIPEVRHGDARVNLLRACMVASTDIAEVVIAFGEYVFRGCRAQKKDERRFDAFESPAEFPLAYITEEILIAPHAYLRNAKWKTGDIELRATFESGVLQVSLIPGLEPELLRPILESEACRGAILQSFGAGNVPSREQYSFQTIIRRATELYKPIIITSQFPANSTLHSAYAASKVAIGAGAIPTGNMTASCAAAKFRWVLAQVESMIRAGDLNIDGKIAKVNELMQHRFVGEVDKPQNGGHLT